MSLRVDASLSGDSKKSRVRGSDRNARSRVRRAVFLPGRKPRKAKESVGRPETLKAEMIAQAPGTGETQSPRSREARTSRYPGSAMDGVPASLTNAMSIPDSRRSTNQPVRCCSLCSW